MSVLQAARRRKAQQVFLARGRASLDKAGATGESHDLDPVLDEMQARLKQRMAELRKSAEPTAKRSRP